MSIERARRRVPNAAFAFAFLLALRVTIEPATGASLPQLDLKLTGNPEVMFDMTRESCDPQDVMPDISPRAFRDSTGQIVFFALHSANRALRGPDLSNLKLDCHIVLESGGDANPAHYNDASFISGTWTDDGRNVDALIHHEYHADDFGRCSVQDALGCWYNTVLAYRSTDGGKNFTRASPLVVAAAPFTQDVGQGRHRGFFNPSNIFSDGRYEYFFAATTGWDGQQFGACLFRSATPQNSASWRAYDGHAFNIRYVDPYRQPPAKVKACAPIAPFVDPLGAVVRDRKSNVWIAVFVAEADQNLFPVEGIYYATAKDFLHWSLPKLLRAGPTFSANFCTTDNIVAYPSILSEDSTGRNFDNFGDKAFLYFTIVTTQKCHAGPRLLMRQPLEIEAESTNP
jgi:hypothetical protein